MKAEQLYSVEGHVAVVTGGANGLGLAFARALADNGARVTILDIDERAIADAVATLTANGGRASGVAIDLADAAAVRRAFDAIAEREGGLDAVFANAGIPAGPGFLKPSGERDPAGAVENIPEYFWARVLDVNLHGVFFTIQAAVPHMKKRGRGRIVVTTSTAGTKTSPTVGNAYLATKAAIAHLVRQVALESPATTFSSTRSSQGPSRRASPRRTC